MKSEFDLSQVKLLLSPARYLSAGRLLLYDFIMALNYFKRVIVEEKCRTLDLKRGGR